MWFQFLLVLTLFDVSFGQYEYSNYPEEDSNYPSEAYPNPEYDAYGEALPQPNPQPQYPDYSYVETVETTTATTTTRRTQRPKRPQVFPPTPTSRPSRRSNSKIVRWYFLDDLGYPIRTAVRRRFRTGSQTSWLPSYYRNMLSGSRSLKANGARTQRVEYWWLT